MSRAQVRRLTELARRRRRLTRPRDPAQVWAASLSDREMNAVLAVYGPANRDPGDRAAQVDWLTGRGREYMGPADDRRTFASYAELRAVAAEVVAKMPAELRAQVGEELPDPVTARETGSPMWEPK